MAEKVVPSQSIAVVPEKYPPMAMRPLGNWASARTDPPGYPATGVTVVPFQTASHPRLIHNRSSPPSSTSPLGSRSAA